MSEEERQIAVRQQEKFEFYLVALVFTLLALSIQTSKFTGPIISQLLELAGWASLLVSGLSGLSYLEWLPVLRIQAVKKEEMQVNADNLKHQKEQGVEQVHVLQNDAVKPIDTRITEYNEVLVKLDEQSTSLENKSGIKYFLFKWLFVIGVILTIFSRAYEPVLNIMKSACN